MSWYNDSWSAYLAVTVALDKTLARIDLSGIESSLRAAFFALANSDGSDLRVTKSDDATEVAIDLRSFDQGNQTGWLVFATGESKSATTGEYHIYVGNSSASAYAAGDTYGRNAVYDSEHERVLSLDEDPSGGAPQFVDRTGSGSNGTANGSMTSGDLVTGLVDGAIDFDGSNDYITVPITFPAGSFSVYCVVKIASSATTLDTVSSIDKTQAGNFGVFYLQIIPTGNDWWRFAVVNTGDTLFAADSTSTTDPTNWQFVGGSYDNSTKVAAINVNGVEEDTATLTGTRSTATGNLFVGAGYFAGPADYFDGIIDEYVLLNVAISESEFAAIQLELIDNASAITFASTLSYFPQLAIAWNYKTLAPLETMEDFQLGEVA